MVSPSSVSTMSCRFRTACAASIVPLQGGIGAVYGLYKGNGGVIWDIWGSYRANAGIYRNIQGR